MKKASAVIAVALALAVAVFVGADVLHACDGSKSASTASAKTWVDAALATMPADASSCCRTAVAGAVTACYNKTANYASSTRCAKSAEAALAATGACSAGVASTKTAGKLSYNDIALAALPAAAGDCCKAAVSAALAQACASAKTASVKTAGVSSSCCASASTAKVAAVGTGASACWKGSASTASARSGCSYWKTSTASIAYADISEREGKTIVLTGNATCGKCNLQVTDGCLTLFQTADGSYYRLIDNNHTGDMRAAKADKGFKIVTRVVKLHGVKYLEVETFSTL